MKDYGQNMLLATSYWGEAKSFRMIPILPDCPYTEVIYDPATTLLVVIGKVKKEKFLTVPRLNENGDPIAPNKKGRPKDKAPHQEQRLSMDVLQEYYVVEMEEQEAFIKSFAVNHEAFDYKKYMKEIGTATNQVMMPEQPAITDDKGNVVKSDQQTPIVEMPAASEPEAQPEAEPQPEEEPAK